MKNIIISFVVGVIVGAIGMYFLKSCPTVPKKIPIKIEVPIPVEDSTFTPVVPTPVIPPINNTPKPINKDLKDDLDDAKTPVDSLAIYKKFAVKNTYKEEFEDDVQTITVDAETTGTLDMLQVAYKTKPKTIVVDTSVTVDVPKKQWFVNVYAQTGIGITNKPEEPFEVPIQVGVDVVTRKRIILGGSYMKIGQGSYFMGKIGYSLGF